MRNRSFMRTVIRVHLRAHFALGVVLGVRGGAFVVFKVRVALAHMLGMHLGCELLMMLVAVEIVVFHLGASR